MYEPVVTDFEFLLYACLSCLSFLFQRLELKLGFPLLDAEEFVLLLFVEMRERLLAGWGIGAVCIFRRHSDTFREP